MAQYMYTADGNYSNVSTVIILQMPNLRTIQQENQGVANTMKKSSRYEYSINPYGSAFSSSKSEKAESPFLPCNQNLRTVHGESLNCKVMPAVFYLAVPLKL